MLITEIPAAPDWLHTVDARIKWMDTIDGLIERGHLTPTKLEAVKRYCLAAQVLEQIDRVQQHNANPVEIAAQIRANATMVADECYQKLMAYSGTRIIQLDAECLETFKLHVFAGGLVLSTAGHKTWDEIRAKVLDAINEVSEVLTP